MASSKTTERATAVSIAAAVLDRPNADPDDDIAILARQFNRAEEEIAQLQKMLFGKDLCVITNK